MKDLNKSTEAPQNTEPVVANKPPVNTYDLLEAYQGYGLYHLTIEGNFKAICGSHLLYYQAVGGKITNYDDKFIYFEEPCYDERRPPNINTYFNWQICKRCLHSLNKK